MRMGTGMGVGVGMEMAAYWEERGRGSSTSCTKAVPRAAGRCAGIFRKPLLAAVPAPLQPSTSGLESLWAACHYAADKRSHFPNSVLLGEVLHGK